SQTPCFPGPLILSYARSMAKKLQQGQALSARIGEVPLNTYGEREIGGRHVRFGITGEEISSLQDEAEAFRVFGQPRALEALHMGLEMRGKGYNVFVTGMPGTGKRTAVTRIIRSYRGDLSRLRDIAFVYNFRNPDRPQVLYFRPGESRAFRQTLSEIVAAVRRRITLLAESQNFKRKRDRLVTQAEGQANAALREFEGRLQNEGFNIVQRRGEQQDETDLAPLYEGEPTSFEDLRQRVKQGELDDDSWHRMREKYYRYLDELNQIFQRLDSQREQVEDSLRELRVREVSPELDKDVRALKEQYPDPRITAYLDDLREDILRHLDWFAGYEDDEQGNPSDFERYQINTVVDHGDTKQAPLVYETNPDYQRLFGLQEYAQETGGEIKSGFMYLRAGALLEASGGFLVLRGDDLLTQEDLWNTLKRALDTETTEIRPTAGSTPVPAGFLKPEPVEISVKVVILGSEHLYDLLFNHDEEFGKLFKVPAEFDATMPRNRPNTGEYIGFIRMIVEEEELLPTTPDGIAAVVEYGVRLSEFRDRLSTRFAMIGDLVREADYWARRSDRTEIDRPAVEQAVSKRVYFSNLPEEKIDDQIISGELLISVTDRAVGRINGLAIVDRGYYSFARPILITARTAPGDTGIVNIERESGLSGEIHDKGVYILEGFLRSKYATTFPLSIHASIAFEQSYVEVDGDSASSPEVYVLLSAIAGLPLRQDIAVTGSVNQMGEIQPVGGISEKIEGFFAVCKKVGLTGEQGVIIPRKNLANLILNREVQNAVETGAFHIYSIDTVDEGLEILSGVPAGGHATEDEFEPGSVNAEVSRRLREMARQVKDFGGS
ncbi:MAG: Lon protease family protein, partial [Spirochaetaceae bacterium]